eukprot:Hpha_TRINITY_DN16499_c0_g18::TRINITY_DN16499_c0_g18_i1::g.159355::m.159355
MAAPQERKLYTAGIVLTVCACLSSLWRWRTDAQRADALELATDAKEIGVMHREISTQLDRLQQNLTTVVQYMEDFRERQRQLKAESENGEDPMTQVEEAVLGKVKRLVTFFEDQITKLQKARKGAMDQMTQYLDNKKGGRFIVKWHGKTGVTTSPRFSSEEQAYQYFVHCGDFAKKLLMFDGTRWILVKSYGGQQWLALMTDDANYQQGELKGG